MKKNSIFKYITGIVIGILLTSIVGVYAVTAIIDSKEVSYDNENSNGNYDNVQDSIDELYKKAKALSGEQDTIYTEGILNGADPVLGDGMIPITLEDDGTVKYANLYTPWYKYASKRWANAVILVDSPSKSYKTGDTILEKDIESYFVWIPRYSYKIWDLGNYTNAYSLDGSNDTTKLTNTPNDATSIRHIIGKARIIDVRFGKSENETTQAVGSYYTHQAFTNFGVSGLWVGKFITGYNQGTVGQPITNTDNWTTEEAQKNIMSSEHIIVKPNVYSWRSQTVGNIFKTAFNYKNISGSHNTNLDPHMMKNTEWGAVAYLSHSIYGIGSEVNINNNSSYLTGYSAALNTDQTAYSGEQGTTKDKTQPWNTPVGHLASTTGNITGIYDMSGNSLKYLAAYMEGYGVQSSGGYSSGLTEQEFSTYSKYFDKYAKTDNDHSFNKRILGDATGEMGPFYYYYDKSGAMRYHNSWYADNSQFIKPADPWFLRGGDYFNGILGGQFNFDSGSGSGANTTSSRLVLAVK